MIGVRVRGDKETDTDREPANTSLLDFQLPEP